MNPPHNPAVALGLLLLTCLTAWAVVGAVALGAWKVGPWGIPLLAAALTLIWVGTGDHNK